MPNTIEKLIELLEEAPGHANTEVYSFAEIADHLIANGVTIQKWIPVDEEFPNSGKHIIVANFYKCHTPRIVKRDALMARESWGIVTGHYAHGQQVTHWTPLPEPPKESDDE
jgi:hypothetical protein